MALVGEDIVADATLHRHRAGACRHIGGIRVVVDPDYRNMGIGSSLVREVVDIGYDNVSFLTFLQGILASPSWLEPTSYPFSTSRWWTTAYLLKFRSPKPMGQHPA